MGATRDAGVRFFPGPGRRRGVCLDLTLGHRAMASSRAPRRAPRRAPLTPTSVFPTDVVVETTIDMFLASVDALHTDQRTRDACRVLASAVLLYATVDRACRRVVAQSVRLKYYLFYAWSLDERPHAERRFLDGTFGVALFAGSYGAGPRDLERFAGMSPLDVLKDRVRTAAKLATFDEVQLRARSSHYFPDDLPHGVGNRVAAFVGRCRLLVQCVAASDGGAACVTACDHCDCGAEMLNLGIGRIRPTMQELFGADGVSSAEDDDDDDYCAPPTSWARVSSSYWARLCPGVLTTLPRLQFCSKACVLAYERELEAVMPVSVLSLESHETQSSVQGKVGLARVVAVARAAVKRNAAAVRALRQARHATRRRNMTLSASLVARMHENVQDMLAIDLSLLMASAAIAEAPVVANGRILPGTHHDWRNDPSRWSRAIELVKSIYLANRGPASRERAVDERDAPTWLRKTIDSAPQLFPVEPAENT